MVIFFASPAPTILPIRSVISRAALLVNVNAKTLCANLLNKCPAERFSANEAKSSMWIQNFINVDVCATIQGPKFEPEKNIASIKFFENDFSAAIVREQILDHLEWTTNNEKKSIIDYSQSNFTNDEWEYLKKMKDMIVEFGKIYK